MSTMTQVANTVASSLPVLTLAADTLLFTRFERSSIDQSSMTIYYPTIGELARSIVNEPEPQDFWATTATGPIHLIDISSPEARAELDFVAGTVWDERLVARVSALQSSVALRTKGLGESRIEYHIESIVHDDMRQRALKLSDRSPSLRRALSRLPS